MAEVSLAGCAPEPLMGYLKALGLFRLVAEQGDPAASGRWKEESYWLSSKLDADGLRRFFLERYQPTPLLAPWNGGSGFYGGGSEPLQAIEASTTPRLDHFRTVAGEMRRLVPKEKPKDEDKEGLLRRCRGELDDRVIAWLDACFVLGPDGPSYLPMLGTGGNDGRFDFTNNLMQHLAAVIPFVEGATCEGTEELLDAALFGTGQVQLAKKAVGQFNPGGTGGANAVQGSFEADFRVNPWDFVLMLEGAVLLAGSVARRLGSDARGRGAFPFSVKAVAVGYGSAASADETTDGSRDELWLPLWKDFATLPEIRRLFAEGRAQVGRRQARNAIDFALAVSLLGVSRGIDSFVRYGFLKRNGLSYLAAPLGRFAVHDQERPRARLLDEPAFSRWVESLRRACNDKSRTPGRYLSALRGIDKAIFDFTQRPQADQGGEAKALRDLMAALGRAERTLAGGLRFCKEHDLSPIQGLNPGWLLIGTGGEEWREFRLAASLASVLAAKKGKVGPLRIHLEETESKGRIAWSAGSASAVWSAKPLPANLVAVLLRRWMESERGGVEGVALRGQLPARLADVVAFINAQVDDDLLADLLWALIGVDWWHTDWSKGSKFRQSLMKC
ncbi:MAG: type I-U CRISPR-associated protein Csx17, partial [Gemmataceae bacterium]|nr:type I-U CRISPR-associated protein Csx17 [Gemmataceae bacterium]